MSEELLSILANVGLLSFLALSAYILLIGGEMSFGQQAFFGIGAYSAGLATVMGRMPLGLALLLAVLAGAAASGLLGLVTLRLRGLFFSMSTLAAAEAANEAIAANPDAPDFANTIAAMETADEDLNRVLSVFYTLAGVDSNDVRQALQRDFAPRLAEYGSRISMDPRLYARVRAVAAAADGLSPEDRRITELALRDLTRAGAGLDEAGRGRMAQIRARLAVLTTEFTQPDEDVLQPLIAADSEAFAKENNITPRCN